MSGQPGALSPAELGRACTRLVHARWCELANGETQQRLVNSVRVRQMLGARLTREAVGQIAAELLREQHLAEACELAEVAACVAVDDILRENRSRCAALLNAAVRAASQDGGAALREVLPLVTSRAVLLKG